MEKGTVSKRAGQTFQIQIRQYASGQSLPAMESGPKRHHRRHADQELFAPLNPTVNFAQGDDFSVKRDEMTPFLLSRFDDFSRALSSSGGKIFIDDVPRACDFAVFHHLHLSTKLDKSLLAKFPLLEKFVENIETIASVRAYLDTRPKLIDVSVMPKLVIDGAPHPTGIQKPNLFPAPHITIEYACS